LRLRRLVNLGRRSAQSTYYRTRKRAGITAANERPGLLYGVDGSEASAE